MAVFGPSLGVIMNGHNNIHSQLTKSLEKIIEDAYLSGELKLSGRKLKDFPKSVKFDLCDTVVADLSKNRFTEVPDEVTTYVYLERLFLSQNGIRALTDAVGSLQSLTFLDLSSNHLTELPREICQLPLQVLLVSDNTLTSLPKEIGRMATLAELDAAFNRLTQVPMTLGDCGGLRALNLNNNQLGLLPLQITYLKLEHLDVSCNCISSLPLELRNMNSLVTLNLDNNPLVSPPTTTCMKGRVHIFKYLENLANKDMLSHKRVDETKRGTKHNSYMSTTPPQSVNHQIISGNATIDCLRHKPRQVVDSGYSTDGVDKRWCNDAGGEGGGGSGRSTPSTPSTLSPGTALSRAHSVSSDSPLAGLRISPEGNIANGDDKTKLTHQQTYRQYKEALRQQRQQDVYRSRTDQPSPDIDSPRSQNQSPVHIQRSQSSPHSPILNGYSNASPTLYNRTVSSNSSISSVSPNTSNVPNSPLLHSTPRRYQNLINQNGNVSETKPEESQIKRPVQKVVPSRNVNNKCSSNGNTDYLNGKLNGPQSQLRPEGDTYIKPPSPTKSPTHNYNSLGSNKLRNGAAENSSKLLTTSVSYLKGPGSKTASAAGKMGWNNEVAADKLSFTMKREFDKQKEESELLEQLRVVLEARLKMRLPARLAPVLADGVVLCHLANQLRPRAVASVHVPSAAQPKLTMARCRRNVDNFLEACRRIGVEEENICTAEDILCHHPDLAAENVSLAPLLRTVAVMLQHATPTRSANHENLTSQENIIDTDMVDRVACNIDPNQTYYCDVTNEYSSYYQSHHVYRNRYSEDRIVSNFNVLSMESHQYTIDERDEYELYDNNNAGSAENSNYSPSYETETGVRNRNYSYQNNKIQYVVPFLKDNGVLENEHFEIYDTDVVDGCQLVTEETSEAERYDRAKMSLNIENNLNQQLNEANTGMNAEDAKRLQVTALCLGSFFISLIVLFFFPL